MLLVCLVWSFWATSLEVINICQRELLYLSLLWCLLGLTIGGFTPLHLACQMGHWQLLPCLARTSRRGGAVASTFGLSQKQHVARAIRTVGSHVGQKKILSVICWMMLPWFALWSHKAPGLLYTVIGWGWSIPNLDYSDHFIMFECKLSTLSQALEFCQHVSCGCSAMSWKQNVKPTLCQDFCPFIMSSGWGHAEAVGDTENPRKSQGGEDLEDLWWNLVKSCWKKYLSTLALCKPFWARKSAVALAQQKVYCSRGRDGVSHDTVRFVGYGCAWKLHETTMLDAYPMLPQYWWCMCLLTTRYERVAAWGPSPQCPCRCRDFSKQITPCWSWPIRPSQRRKHGFCMLLLFETSILWGLWSLRGTSRWMWQMPTAGGCWDVLWPESTTFHHDSIWFQSASVPQEDRHG